MIEYWLQAREDHIRNVLDEGRANLSKISADTARYPAILKGLIMQVIVFPYTQSIGSCYIFLFVYNECIVVLQGLLQLLEKEVHLRCRQKDQSLVEQLLPECLDALEKQWGNKSKVSIQCIIFSLTEGTAACSWYSHNISKPLNC